VADEVAAGCEQPTASVTFAAAVLLYQKPVMKLFELRARYLPFATNLETSERSSVIVSDRQ